MQILNKLSIDTSQEGQYLSSSTLVLAENGAPMLKSPVDSLHGGTQYVRSTSLAWSKSAQKNAYSIINDCKVDALNSQKFNDNWVQTILAKVQCQRIKEKYILCCNTQTHSKRACFFLESPWWKLVIIAVHCWAYISKSAKLR